MGKNKELPYIVAYDIKWDTDDNSDVFDQLPTEIAIPVEILKGNDEDAVSDYLSDQTGFCHAGCKVGLCFRGKIIPYSTNWLDDATFLFCTEEGYLKDNDGDSFILKFEYHLDETRFVDEVEWEDDSALVCDLNFRDNFLTTDEQSAIEEICYAMILTDVEDYEAASTGEADEAVDSVEVVTGPQSMDVKVPGGILRAKACTDPAYPGISVEFIPDEGDPNAGSLPCVLMGKIVEEDKLRAIVWGNKLQEDPSHIIGFF